jgi:hypothetical protein
MESAAGNPHRVPHPPQLTQALLRGAAVQFAAGRIIEIALGANRNGAFSLFSADLFLVRILPIPDRMFLSFSTRSSKKRAAYTLRHNFVVGPRTASAITGELSQLFYCARCRWRFLVSRSGVVVLHDDGSVMTGPEADSRFASFECGPCPALEVLDPTRSAPAAAPLSFEAPRLRGRRAAWLRPVPRPVRRFGPKF